MESFTKFKGALVSVLAFMLSPLGIHEGVASSLYRASNSSETISTIVAPATRTIAGNSEGDIIVLKDQRLLLAYSEFYAGDYSDFAPARIAAKISQDGGRTWGEKFILAEPKEGLRNATSASLLRLKDGRILLGYSKYISLSNAQYFIRFSGDEAKTWTREFCAIPDAVWGFVSNNKLIQLGSGRILAPYSFSPDYEKENHFKAKVYYSDDAGKTWRPSKTVLDLPKRGVMEPGLVELKDGRLLMYMRTQLARVYRSFSKDQGDTWSEPEAMLLQCPESPAAMTRIPSNGDLLVVFNNNFNPHRRVRRPLTAAVSKDEGESWSFFRNLETDAAHEYSYPSITLFQDRVLLTYYRFTRQKDQQFGEGEQQFSDLVFRSIPLKWFYE